jgi:hypothetical protein
MNKTRLIAFAVVAVMLVGLLFTLKNVQISLAKDGKQTDPPVFSINDKDILRLDNDTGRPITVYRSKRVYLRRSSLSVAPNNKAIAFVESDSGKFFSREAAMQGVYDVPPPTYLQIADIDGNLIFSVNDALEYCWSPDGDGIAYITYDIILADYEYRYPTGLWVIDLKTGKREKLVARAAKLNWAMHDNCLYYVVWDSTGTFMYKWDPESKLISETHHKNIYFSPDGLYYITLRDYDAGILLFQTQTDSEVYPIDVGAKDVQIPEFLRGLGKIVTSGKLFCPPYGWVFNKGHYLLFVSKGGNSVVDVETRRVVKRFEGEIWKWVGNGDAIPVEKDGHVLLGELQE